MKLKITALKCVVALAAVVMLGSCNLYKKYETPDGTALTKEYKEAVAAGTDSTSFGNLAWQSVFTDATLQSLIEQALANNTNLRNAQLNVEIAHANLQGAKLNYFPSVALAPNGSISKFFIDGAQWSKTYQIPLQVSWEVDIFGKLLNAKRSAQVAVLQSEEYAQAARSQIIAGVANTYYAIALVEGQLELSRKTAENWRLSVQTMRDLKESGKVNESAVVQSEAQYYGILASITDLEVSLGELHNTMSLLVGVMPDRWWIVSPTAELNVPEIYSESIPMRELAARPDVRAAELQLASAYYATNMARANFYPGLNISLSGGFTNSIGTAIINPGKFFLSLAGSLAAPLFSRGANIANLKGAKVRQQQALNSFEYTLMSASAEVSDALNLYNKANEKEGLLKKQAASLEKSVEITQTLLALGSFGTTYLEVLTAQSNLLNAQMGVLASRNNKARAVINLYQSLGGGR